MDAPAPPAPPQDLIVSLAFDPMHGIADLEAQLAALKEGADAVGAPFDRHAVRNELQAATFRLRDPATLRLLVSPSGALAIESTRHG